MTDFEQIMNAYDDALRQTTEELLSQNVDNLDGREHVTLLSSLLHSVLRTYGVHHLQRMSNLPTTTSVMYAADQGSDRILDVPLRGLVDAGSVTVWQARFLSGLLTMRRTLLLTGPARAGKSTLLNSLVQLVPVDERVVAVEDEPGLPTLRQRSFTVRLSATPGTPSFATVLKKAADMRPTWLLAGTLQPSDLPAFLDAVQQGPAGLATMEAPDTETALEAWTSDLPDLPGRLNTVRPFFLHVERDEVGRPRLARLLDSVADGGSVRLEERRQQ